MEWIDPISAQQQSLIKHVNIDDSHKRMGSVKQVTALTCGFTTEHDLLNKGSNPLDTHSNSWDQYLYRTVSSWIPKHGESQFLEEFILKLDEFMEEQSLESHWAHRNNSYLRTAPAWTAVEVQKIIFRSGIILRTHRSYTPARASMPAPNSRQVTESHRSLSWSGTASLVLTDSHCLLLVLALWLLQTDEGFVPTVL